MTEITVLADTGERINLYKLTRLELEELFDDIILADGKLASKLPLYVVSNIIHSIDVLRPKPNTSIAMRIAQSPELILRNAIAMSYDRGWKLFVPILGSRSVLTGSAHQNRTNNNTYDGGAVIKIFRPHMHKKVVVDVSAKSATYITVSFDRAIRCIRDSVEVIIAAQSSVDVAGLRVYACECTIGDTYIDAGHVDFYFTSPEISRAIIVAVTRYLYIRAATIDVMAQLPPIARTVAARDWQLLDASDWPRTKLYATRIRDVLVDEFTLPGPLAYTPDDAFLTLIRDRKIFGNVSLATPLVTYSGLDQYRLGDAWLLSQINGVDADDVSALIDSATASRVRLASDAQASRETWKLRERLTAYRRILKTTVTAARWLRIASQDNISSLMRALTADERKALDTEYASEIAYVEGQLNNGCRHVAAYRALRGAQNYGESVRLLKELLAIVGKGPQARGTMMICGVCNYPAICPHIVESVRLAATGTPPGEIRAMLDEFAAANSTKAAYNCKICHEIMYSDFDFHDDLVADVSYDDELRRLIRSEAATVLREITFKHLINTKHLLNKIRDSTYEIASMIERSLSQIKSQTISEINHKKAIDICILVIATYIRIMMVTPDMSFIKYKGAPGKLPELVKHAAGIVMSVKNISIREIRGITHESIREKIMSTVTVLGGDEVIKLEELDKDSPEALFMRIYYDPTYQWIVHARGDRDPVKAFKSIMGGTVDSLLKRARKSSDTQLSVWHTVTATPNVYRARYIIESYVHFLALVRRGGYIYATGESGDVIFETGDESVVATIAKLAAEFEEPRLRSLIRNWTRGGIAGVASQPIDKTVPLGTVFDEDGRLHVWNKYIIGGETVSAGDLTQQMLNGKYVDVHAAANMFGIITDVICGICGVKRKAAAGLDEVRIRDALADKNTMESFFRFYEQRCPASDASVHVFVGGVCEKCGAPAGGWKDMAATGAYYVKYKDTFVAAKSTFANVIRSREPAIDTSARDVSPSDTPPAIKWVEKFDIIMYIAKITKINHRLITTLGAYEGTSVDAISSGTWTPIVAEHRDDTRVWMVHAMVCNMMVEWDRIRNYNTMKTHSYYTQSIMQNVSRALLGELIDVTGDYFALFEWFRWNEPPERTISMCIQEWCARLMQIYDVADADTEQLRHEFVITQVKNTIALHELFTPREPFNWSIIYGDKDAPDVIEVFDPVEDSIAHDKLFSQNAFDMDGEVEIHFGDN